MDLKIPPLVVVLISILAQFDARDYVPVYSLHFIPDWIPVLWVCFGLLICLLGVVEFVKHKTTVNPIKPETTKSIVDTGIFHYTRNPMCIFRSKPDT
jgi:protein-S-isoprenylcysteine O-methyltransferase Ste14